MDTKTKKTLLDEYKEDIKVHKDKLHIDWLNLAENQYKWGIRHVETVSLKNKKKQQHEIICSNLRKRIRKTWEGKKQPTAQEVEDLIITTPEYLESFNELLDLEEATGILFSCVSGFDHKRTSLKYLSDLKMKGYWGNLPVEPEFIDEHLVKRKLKI